MTRLDRVVRSVVGRTTRVGRDGFHRHFQLLALHDAFLLVLRLHYIFFGIWLGVSFCGMCKVCLLMSECG
jgi:fatty-acid desaturase